MKKLLFLLIPTVFAFNVNAQLVSEVGFGLHLYKHNGHIINSFYPGTEKGTVLYREEVDHVDGAPMLGLYLYHPLFKITDGLSLGAQSGLDFFLNYQAPEDIQNQHGHIIGSYGGSDMQAGFRIPLLAMLRVGCLSDYDNDEGFGAAFGFGLNALGFTVPYEKGFMLAPAIAAGVNYNGFGLRFDMPLKKYNSYYKSETGDIPRLTTSFYSFKISYSIDLY